jgi:thioredoxin-related protein
MSIAAKIETTANAATIVVAVLISIVLFKTFVLAKPNIRQSSGVSAAEIVQGKKVDGHLGVNWAKNHRTLVMAISTTCHYCKDSVPFYHTLTTAGANVKIVAVLPQSVAEGQQYLSSGGVHVDEVKQVPLDSLGVRGTPTLMLVNDAGVVTDIWVGKLPPDQETKVLAAVEKKTS